MTNFTPKEIVAQLDRFIVGQNKAKAAVAVALRNRWRRKNITDSFLREEITPKNILMIGPTGCGKTEIARRLAKLAQAPFVKVEATKFTEVGYVGRDVEQIIRDLMEVAINMIKEDSKKKVTSKAQKQAMDKVLDAIIGEKASDITRDSFKSKLIAGKLDDNEIEIEVKDTGNGGANFDIPGMPGAQLGMINMGDMMSKALGGTPTKKRKLNVAKALILLQEEIADDLLDQDAIIQAALSQVEQEGIVFIDEVDKICGKDSNKKSDISREGVQRDLLPLIEGTCVSTKYGQIRTEHILFIASGAFHVSKPADLLPELQGRLPIRVELSALVKEDFIRILKEPEANLLIQYHALMMTEGVELEFDEDSIDEIAELAAKVNENVENIGARRLQTIMEKLLEEISFNAPDLNKQKIKITKQMVSDTVGNLTKADDLSKFIL